MVNRDYITAHQFVIFIIKSIFIYYSIGSDVAIAPFGTTVTQLEITYKSLIYNKSKSCI